MTDATVHKYRVELNREEGNKGAYSFYLHGYVPVRDELERKVITAAVMVALKEAVEKIGGWHEAGGLIDAYFVTANGVTRLYPKEDG